MTYLNALPQSLVTTINLADRVATCATAAADRAIAVWSFLTQPQAIATYKWLGRMALALVYLAWVCAVWAYVQVKQWVDVEVYLAQPLVPSARVSDAIAKLTDAELEAEFNDCFEPDFYKECQPYIEAQPQAMTTAIAVCTVGIGISDQIAAADRYVELKEMTLAQLKPIAAALNIPTRKVRKADLIESILASESYKI